MANRPGDEEYKRRRRKLKRTSNVCHICGDYIDPALKWPHPMSFSADHLAPVSRGGDNLGEILPSHLTCNVRRGNDIGLGRTRRSNNRMRKEKHPGLN